MRFESAFEEGGAAPRVARVGVSIDDARVLILYGEPKDDVTLSVRDGNAEHTLDRDELKSILPHLSRDEANVYYSFLFWFLRYVSEERRQSKKRTSVLLRSISDKLVRFSVRADERPYALGPVRSEPKRTYDPMGESFHPAGDHIPMVLSRIYFEDQARWVGLKKSLEEFGRASGLFRGLNVRPLGRRSAGDPFQVTVRISGLSNSLLDVGYGVSQALPIVVEALRTESARTLLLQQPEVHLHPRAQAELGSLLTSLVHLREEIYR